MNHYRIDLGAVIFLLAVVRIMSQNHTNYDASMQYCGIA